MDIQNMEYVPTLTLEPTEEKKAPSADEAVAKAAAEAAKLDISKLSPAEQKAVHDFADKIDITDTNAILQYGASSQKNISNFSDTKPYFSLDIH